MVPGREDCRDQVDDRGMPLVEAAPAGQALAPVGIPREVDLGVDEVVPLGELPDDGAGAVGEAVPFSTTSSCCGP